jgi:tetratricopeptide (TPR) repeat protein
MKGPGRQMKMLIKLFVLLSLFFVSAEAGAGGESYEKALRLFKDGDYKNAVVYLEKYISQRPDPAAYYMLGYACYELREFHKAREYFNAAFLIDPDFTFNKIFEHSALWDEECKLIGEMLEISGAKEQISYYADVVGSGLPQLQGNLGEQKIKEELLRLIRESYRSDKIYPSVVQVFHTRFHKEHIISVLSWLKAPVGQKMTKFEIYANSQDGIKRARAFAAEYQKIGEDRKKLLIRFEKTLRATDMNIEVVSVSLLEMLMAMQSQVDGKNRMSPEEIDAIVGNVRDMPRDRLRSNVMVSLAFVYRDLTDEELESAIKFFEAPAGKWYTETSIKAITSAIGKASREIGEKAGKSLMTKDIPI